MSDLLVVQIVPAAAGWRTVNALLGFSGDLATADDESILWVEHIACFALVEDGSRERRVVHVAPQDWPHVLVVETDDQRHFMGFLGPGEQVADDHREAAREMIAEHQSANSHSQAGDAS